MKPIACPWAPVVEAVNLRVIRFDMGAQTGLRCHLDWDAERGPMVCCSWERRASCSAGPPPVHRRSTAGRKWRKVRVVVGMPDGFRFYDLRHTGHTLATRSGATLKDTMVQAGQSSERAAMIYQHYDLERQQEVADGWTTSCASPVRRPRTSLLVRIWCETPELVQTTKKPPAAGLGL